MIVFCCYVCEFYIFSKMESLAAKNKQALTRKTYEVSFDLSATNYEAVENIGSGAYGVVCSAINKATKDKVCTL